MWVIGLSQKWIILLLQHVCVIPQQFVSKCNFLIITEWLAMFFYLYLILWSELLSLFSLFLTYHLDIAEIELQ